MHNSNYLQPIPRYKRRVGLRVLLPLIRIYIEMYTSFTFGLLCLSFGFFGRYKGNRGFASPYKKIPL